MTEIEFNSLLVRASNIILDDQLNMLYSSNAHSSVDLPDRVVSVSIEVFINNEENPYTVRYYDISRDDGFFEIEWCTGEHCPLFEDFMVPGKLGYPPITDDVLPHITGIKAQFMTTHQRTIL